MAADVPNNACLWATKVMNALQKYFQAVEQQLAAIQNEEKQRLETAADWVAAALLADRFIYVFGSGHSHTLGEEAFYRAGGLVRAVAILDENLMVHKSATGSTEWERKEGYAAQVLSRYPLTTGDVLFIVSNSGRNAVPIEMAMEAKKRGARVIAISSRQYSLAFPSRHSSGKRLMDVADLAIDNHSTAGDAIVEVQGLQQKVAPTSTIVSAFIWNSVVAAAVERVVAAGGEPEVYASANSDTGDLNKAFLQKYRGRIPHL